MTSSAPTTATPAPLTRRLPMRFSEHRRAAFGLTICRHRTTCGLSRDALAVLVGLNAADVAAIEDRGLLPSLDTIFAIADVLDTDAAELLHDTRTETERMVVEDWLRRNCSAFADAEGLVGLPPAVPTPITRRGYTGGDRAS